LFSLASDRKNDDAQQQPATQFTLKHTRR
jgi:hypothetical protein